VECLAAYAETIKNTPAVISPGQLLLPATQAQREAVRHSLGHCDLLSWSTQGKVQQVTLAQDFVPECPEIVAKLVQYSAAIKSWVREESISDIARALRKGAVLFNHHLFFEVHEVLEAQWIQEVDPERRFLQGLIQIAVAFYHQSNGNLRGTLSLLKDGLEKIEPYAAVYLGVELSDFAVDIADCRQDIEQLGQEGMGQFQRERIPRIRFVSEASTRSHLN
jgi:predicted metal-dependent hydrolase